jgi:hypothetical protein
MNPTGRKTTKDGAKFRQQYLANLALEASNIQTNTNANIIFKETGSTPSKSTDPRNATEKYAGLEGKKQLIRDTLSGANIMSTHVAEDVIQTLSGPEIDFFDSYREFIMSDFKPRNVPAKVFIDYLRRLIKKTNITKGVEYGLQQETGAGILINSQLALATSITPDFIDRQILKLREAGIDERLIGGFKQKLDTIAQLAITPDEVEQLNTILDSQAASRGAAIMELISEIAEAIPAAEDVESEVSEASRTGDMRPVFASLDGVERVGPTREELLEQLRRNRTSRSALRAPNDDEDSESDIDADSPFARPPPSEGSEYGEEAKEERSVLGEEKEGGYAYRNISRFGQLIDAERRLIMNDIAKNEHESGVFAQFKRMSVVDKRRVLEREHRVNPEDMRDLGNDDLTDLYLNIWSRDHRFVYQPQEAQEAVAEGRLAGHGLRGRGLIKKKPKTAVERSEGYTKPKAYKQFGRYLLNHHKLDEGILMLKSPSGAAIPKIPSERVSHNMAKAVRSIGSGLSPSLSDFNSLSEDEKKKLHHISTHSRVAHNIPNPKLNDDETDLNRFNILRGELVAGNDSTPLKKEFKTLLKKFMKEGRLPRQQVNEILAELL